MTNGNIILVLIYTYIFFSHYFTFRLCIIMEELLAIFGLRFVIAPKDSFCLDKPISDGALILHNPNHQGLNKRFSRFYYS